MIVKTKKNSSNLTEGTVDNLTKESVFCGIDITQSQLSPLTQHISCGKRIYNILTHKYLIS